jgi:hypothetical protein
MLQQQAVGRGCRGQVVGREAWKHNTSAAKKFGVDVKEKSWREVGKKG